MTKAAEAAPPETPKRKRKSGEYLVQSATNTEGAMGEYLDVDAGPFADTAAAKKHLRDNGKSG